VYTGESGSGGNSTVDGTVSIKGARSTLAQEQLVSMRNDDINVQFQYNVPYNQDQADIVGEVSGTASITHSNSMAVLQSTSSGSAFLRSVDSIRYFPGHEFAAEMTAVASSGANGSAAWGVGDNGSTGDCVAFTVQDGMFAKKFYLSSSKGGIKAVRGISYKQKLGLNQMNFERFTRQPVSRSLQKFPNRIANGHLTIRGRW
jgi:hypothetical protein